MKQQKLKYEELFREFLQNRFDNPRVISDCISRCRRVQKYEGDLSEHFEEDRGKSLLDLLSYTKEDANQNISPRHSVIINGTKGFSSLYEGTHSLNNAVKIYFEFMKLQVNK